MKGASIALTALLGLASLAVAAPAAAMSGHGDHGSHGATMAMADTAASRSEGTVNKVDPAAGKITIKHGPLENLGMPPMTMVFTAAEPALLEGVKAGDKVRFVAEKVGGRFTVTALEVVR